MTGTWKEAVLGVIAISMCAGIFRQLGIIGKNKAQLQSLFSLVLLVSVISPLLSFAKTVRADFGAVTGNAITEDDRASAYEQTTVTYAKKQTEEALCRRISAETGIPFYDIAAELSLDATDPGAIVITEVCVTLCGVAYRIISDKVRACAETMLFCPCEVVIVGEDGGK